MELFGLDINPVPEGATVGAIQTSDGVTLRFARWETLARRGLGTVCLMQGRAESIEKYFEVIGGLRRRGFAVAAFDWRGQGGSDRRLHNRRKGHVDSFAEYDTDLEAFMQQVALPDCPPPHYALAHSTGGLISLRAVRAGRVRFARMVLASPLIELAPARAPQPIAFRVAGFLTAIGLGELDVPAGKRSVPMDRMAFEDNPLTSDPVRFARNGAIAKRLPNLTIGVPTIGWLYAAGRAMHAAAEPDFGSAVRVPVLMIAGSRDEVVSPRAIEALAGALNAGAHVSIAGARHELMMERDMLREQFWAAFDAFVPGSS
jgi:lysophospholipase